MENRDREIERLHRVLDGGRSADTLSLESRLKSNEKIIANQNAQVEFDLILLIIGLIIVFRLIFFMKLIEHSNDVFRKLRIINEISRTNNTKNV